MHELLAHEQDRLASMVTQNAFSRFRIVSLWTYSTASRGRHASLTAELNPMSRSYGVRKEPICTPSAFRFTDKETVPMLTAGKCLVPLSGDVFQVRCGASHSCGKDVQGQGIAVLELIGEWSEERFYMCADSTTCRYAPVQVFRLGVSSTGRREP